MSDYRKPNFVLVHGAWNGARCWDEVVRRLAQRGYPAVAPDLPGHGAKARVPTSYVVTPQNPAAIAAEPSSLASITLEDYRDTVIAVIQELTAVGSGPVILVGHSAGGCTLGAVGEAIPESIRRLVYLSAFVPVRFPSLLGYLGEPSMASSETSDTFVGDPKATGVLRINFKSTDAAYIARIRSAFYGDADDATFEAARELCTPDEPVRPLADQVVVTRGRWGGISRAYIRCSADRALPPSVQAQMVVDADAYTPRNTFLQMNLPTAHSPFVTNPQALVEMLISLV